MKLVKPSNNCKQKNHTPYRRLREDCASEFPALSPWRVRTGGGSQRNTASGKCSCSARTCTAARCSLLTAHSSVLWDFSQTRQVEGQCRHTCWPGCKGGGKSGRRVENGGVEEYVEIREIPDALTLSAHVKRAVREKGVARF
jgi:hypothetical protein